MKYNEIKLPFYNKEGSIRQIREKDGFYVVTRYLHKRTRFYRNYLLKDAQSTVGLEEQFEQNLSEIASLNQNSLMFYKMKKNKQKFRDVNLKRVRKLKNGSLIIALLGLATLVTAQLPVVSILATFISLTSMGVCIKNSLIIEDEKELELYEKALELSENIKNNSDHTQIKKTIYSNIPSSTQNVALTQEKIKKKIK